MSPIRSGLAAALLLLLPAAAQADVFINEIHYDNAGTDVNEALEVVATGGEDLTQYRIVRYNGNGGGVYGTDVLSAGTAVTCGAPVRIAVINYPLDALQNGSPDGMALVGPNDTVIQFLSYEGTMTAADGPAAGMTSTDIGVSEPNTTPVGTSLQLGGASGSAYADFSWNASAAQTFGACNNGQTFGTPVDNPPAVFGTSPEDGASAVLVGALIEVAFNETITVANAAGITLDCGAGTPAIAATANGSTLVITPASASATPS